MRHASIPYAWLAITHSLSAHDLFDLHDAVVYEGVDKMDLKAVQEVWDRLQYRRHTYHVFRPPS